MKIKILLLVILSFSMTLSAIPNWFTSNISEQYTQYFIGKGFAEIQNGNIAEAEAKAKAEALKDVSSTISCKVSGETINQSSEEGSGLEAKVEEYFLSETKVRTDLKIMGYEVLKTERDKRNMYFLIGIPANDLRNSFKNKIENSIRKISADFNVAEEFAGNNPEQSIKKYEECIYQTRLLQDDLQIYLFLNKWKNDLQQNIDTLPSQQKIEKQLTILSDSTPKSTETLANELVKTFLLQQAGNYSFIFYPFEYENTGFISNFGKNYAEICSNILIDKNGWRIVSYSKYKEADLIFRGKILESDNGMFLTLTMESINKRMVKNNQLFVNIITCENIGWDKIKPENLEQALQNKLALYNAIQTDNNLKVELQTDKMSDGPVIYYYDEEPQILVRTNKACYTRLMYIFADGTKTLLIDNYPIATDQANQWIQIPFKGIICEPSGVEQLILQASTEKHPAVNYRREDLGDGTFINIIESDISDQVAVTRGMKLKNPEKEITEKVYQWSVFEK
jgi:hypothetical protein